MKRWRHVAPLLVLFGCYDSRSVETGDAVRIDAPTTAVADGRSLVDIDVLIDPDTTAKDTAIDVEVSHGAIALAAEPDSEEARKLSVKYAGGDRLPLKLRPGNVAGDVVITASVGGQLANHVIHLRRSRAAELALEANKRSIAADGETVLDVTAQLSAVAARNGSGGDGPVPLVSVGEVVRFSVCCELESKLAACSMAPPLQVPARSELKEGQSLVVHAVVDRISGTKDQPEEKVAVVAEIGGKSAPSCDAFNGTLAVTQGRVDVTLRRLLPME